MTILSDIEKKLRGLISQGSNFVQQNPTPMGFVQQQIQKIARTPLSQPVQNFVNKPLVNKILTGPNQFGQTYAQNRYIDPVKNLPQNLQTTFDSSKDWKTRGMAGLGAAGGVATLFPDLTGDIALPAFDFLKGYRSSNIRGGNLQQNLESALKSMSLEKPVGLGTAMTKDPTKETIGNIAELPAMLAMGVVKPKSMKDILADKKLFTGKNAQGIIDEIVGDFKKYSNKTDPERASIALQNKIQQFGPETVIKTWYKAKSQGKEQIKAFWNHMMEEAPGGYKPKVTSLEEPSTGGEIGGTPKTVKIWNKSKFSNDGAYADIPVVRKEENITLYQGSKMGEKRQFWTPDKKYAAQFGDVKEKTGSFYKIDNGNRLTDVYVEAPVSGEIPKPSTGGEIGGVKGKLKTQPQAPTGIPKTVKITN